MIYFVDEEESFLRPYAVEMQMRGYETKQITDADTALETLTAEDAENDVELILLDVMMPGRGDETSEFDRKSTDNYLKTGLVLLKKLAESEENKELLKKTVVFTMSSKSTDLFDEISSTSRKLGVPVLRKSDWTRPLRLGDELEGIMGTITPPKHEAPM